MRKVPLYSRALAAAQPAAAPAEAAPAPRATWRSLCGRHERTLLVSAGALAAALLIGAYALLRPAAHVISQQDIDAAVLNTLENTVLPSPAAKAYEGVQASVVRVRGMGTMHATAAKDKAKSGRKADDETLVEQGIGTGVVIVDKGVILTNLHVVRGFERIQVTFADGLESDAVIIGTAPEHDLAVLQAQTIPDDLAAATMRSTRDLAPGDRVVAVGFPFGIGPSVSSGVVSGLRREYRSPEGKTLLTNLIQFDAAVNPGNSGGPLITSDGHVVGIVTGILNPTEQRVFVGIGFAVPIENAAAAVGVPPF
jgi:serine protease DegQ